jgi:hypothetical protein
MLRAPSLRPPLFDARQKVRHNLPLRLRALRAAVVQTHAHRAGFHVATADDGRSRRREEAGNVHSCSALEIFAPARDSSELNGVALKSESTRTMFARSSATMGLA